MCYHFQNSQHISIHICWRLAIQKRRILFEDFFFFLGWWYLKIRQDTFEASFENLNRSFDCKIKYFKKHIRSKSLHVYLKNHTWVLKTGRSWRDWCQQRCCCTQTETPFAPADSGGEDVLGPCAHSGARSHSTWTEVKTMNKYNARLWKLYISAWLNENV